MSNSCKDGESKSNDDGLSDVNDKLHNMSTADDILSICANCGKEGNDINNICNKCKMAKYCNAACKKKHRKKHKKQCEEHVRIAAERAAELHEIELFKQPPPKEDCPICFLRIPTLDGGFLHMACCGKVICSGCIHAPVFDNQGNKVDEEKCPFCRTPRPTSIEEMIKRYKKRVDVDDPIAIHNIGCHYNDGEYGFPRDYDKALEFYHRASELGYAKAYCNIGWAHDNGIGVERDKKKAKHCYELAAMKGDVTARHNLGLGEQMVGNINRALKHHMIAISSGFAESLEEIKELYTDGEATKDDYSKALQSYQEYLGEIKSKQRDQAAAFSEQYRYY